MRWRQPWENTYPCDSLTLYVNKFPLPTPPQIPDVAASEWGELDAHEILAYDARTNTYQASIDRQNESVVLDVVATVATVSKTPPWELPPLYEDIDQNAFDALSEVPRPETETPETLVVMTYAGHEVTVNGTGVLSVRPPQQS